MVRAEGIELLTDWCFISLRWALVRLPSAA